MSREEKALILQMVAEGKISPEQGAELLRAVMGVPEIPKTSLASGRAGQVGPAGSGSPGFAQGPTAPKLRESIRASVQDTIESARLSAEKAVSDAEEIADSVSKKMEGFGEIAGREGERIGRVLGESGANIGRLIAGMFTGGSYGGPQQELHDTITGELPADGVLDITLITCNGHITLQSADQTGFTLDVKKKVAAASQEEAERLLKDKYEFTQDGNVLKAVTKDASASWNPMSIGFNLTIPTGRKASVRLDSTNGRLTIDRIEGPELRAWTANGRIEIEKCNFDDSEVKTANGRIEYDGRVAKLRGSTANGRIVANLSGVGDWVLDTANGRIEATLKKESGVAYQVDVSTTMGRIDVSGLEDEEVLIDDTKQRTGARRYLARSRGFETAPARATFKGSSAMGKVTVSL